MNSAITTSHPPTISPPSTAGSTSSPLTGDATGPSSPPIHSFAINSPPKHKGIHFSPNRFTQHAKKFSIPGLSSSFSLSSGESGSTANHRKLSPAPVTPGTPSTPGIIASSSSAAMATPRSSSIGSGTTLSTRQLRGKGSVSSGKSTTPPPIPTANLDTTTTTVVLPVLRDENERAYDGGDEGQGGNYADSEAEGDIDDVEGAINLDASANSNDAQFTDAQNTDGRKRSLPIAIPSKLGETSANDPIMAALGARPSSSIECDDGRIIKNGWLNKRGKRKNWNRRWFVLRDHQLSYYKDEREYKPEAIISTADIMSAAMLSDHRKPNHFAVFTSSHNLHLRADTGPDAQEWVEVIKQTANEICESALSSSFQRIGFLSQQDQSDEPLDIPSQPLGIPDYHSPKAGSPGPTFMDYSGTEGLSSCASDTGGQHVKSHKQSSSLPLLESSQTQPSQSSQIPTEAPPSKSYTRYVPPIVTPSELLATVGIGDPNDNKEHIVKRGYMLRLKRRYNQWRKQWVVLTNHRIVFYKSDDRKGGPIKVLHLYDIVDVVDIDPLSKSKKYCLQIITPKKSLRFCAFSEEDLTSWLASLKSVLR